MFRYLNSRFAFDNGYAIISITAKLNAVPATTRINETPNDLINPESFIIALYEVNVISTGHRPTLPAAIAVLPLKDTHNVYHNGNTQLNVSKDKITAFIRTKHFLEKDNFKKCFP